MMQKQSQIMQILKLLSDWMLVEDEPTEKVTSGGIIVVNPQDQPVRIGLVLQVGPGRRYTDRLIPMPDGMVGRRVVFLAGASDTKQGQMLKSYVMEGQRLIRLGDVLGIVEGETKVSK